MTAPMIEWTLELLEWIRGELPARWPGVKLRGSAPELAPDGYRIRFRKEGLEYWLAVRPEVIGSSTVTDVQAVLQARDWVALLQERGYLAVGVQEPFSGVPVLQG